MVDNANVFLRANKNLSEEDILMMSPLQLAYLGDAVHELYTRTYLASRDASVNSLHKEASGFVKAEAQAQILSQIEESLTEEEKRIVKRGRNAKSHTSPKNVDIRDYKNATGFEALLGYLYIRGRDSRLEEIFNLIEA